MFNDVCCLERLEPFQLEIILKEESARDPYPNYGVVWTLCPHTGITSKLLLILYALVAGLLIDKI